MKVIEQLIEYFRRRGELSPQALDCLAERGFIRGCAVEDDADGPYDGGADYDLDEGPFEACQGRLEKSRPTRKPRRGWKATIRRCWRSQLAARRKGENG